LILLCVSPSHLYAADGALDFAFGIAGNATAGFPDVNDVVTAIAIQTDGKIVAAGRTVSIPYATSTITSASVALVRFNRDGTLDTTFGSGGKVVTDFSLPYNEARAMAIQSDGKIIVVGRTWSPGSPAALAVARFNTDGSLDTTFGIGSSLTTLSVMPPGS
jgi:uncharacterized delta-60 repeat protein